MLRTFLGRPLWGENILNLGCVTPNALEWVTAEAKSSASIDCLLCSKSGKVVGFGMFLRVTECRIKAPVEITNQQNTRKWCMVSGYPLLGEWERTYFALNAVSYQDSTLTKVPALKFPGKNQAIQFSQIPVQSASRFNTLIPFPRRFY